MPFPLKEVEPERTFTQPIGWKQMRPKRKQQQPSDPPSPLPVTLGALFAEGRVGPGTADGRWEVLPPG